MIKPSRANRKWTSGYANLLINLDNAPAPYHQPPCVRLCVRMCCFPFYVESYLYMSDKLDILQRQGKRAADVKSVCEDEEQLWELLHHWDMDSIMRHWLCLIWLPHRDTCLCKRVRVRTCVQIWLWMHQPDCDSLWFCYTPEWTSENVSESTNNMITEGRTAHCGLLVCLCQCGLRSFSFFMLNLVNGLKQQNYQSQEG